MIENAVIRKANLNDLDGLCALENAAFDPLKYHTVSRRQYRYLLTKGNADILVFDHTGEVIGAAILFYRKTSMWGRLYSIAVHPRMQGHSIGRMLFEEAERVMIQKGLKGLLCECRQDEDQLSEFYKRRGCEFKETLVNYYPDGKGGIKMQKLFKKD